MKSPSQSSDWEWDDKPVPAVVGWYPILLCYEVQEGMFPHALSSDGVEWNDPMLPVAAIGKAGPFQTKQEAIDWGYDHDPEL